MSELRFIVEFKCDTCGQIAQKYVQFSVMQHRHPKRNSYVATYEGFKVENEDWRVKPNYFDICYPCLERKFPRPIQEVKN